MEDDELGGTCGTHEEVRNEYEILVTGLSQIL
jgi:hypothetical protein